MPNKKTLRSAHVAEACALKHAIDRCHNPKHTYWDNYGGRGISVDPIYRDNTAWSFFQFLEEVGLRPGPEYSLDRIDNNRGYEPGNMRWATREEQQRNRRKARARTDYGWGMGHSEVWDRNGHLRRQPSPFIEHNGVRKTQAEWSRDLGIAKATLRQRMAKGWPLEVALNPNLYQPLSKQLDADIRASKDKAAQATANCIDLLNASIDAVSKRQH